MIAPAARIGQWTAVPGSSIFPGLKQRIPALTRGSRSRPCAPGPILPITTVRPRPADWRRLHDEASRNRETFYLDPATGLAVFTEFGLRQRGSCCRSGCRHCPWEADRADTGEDAPTVEPPHWLTRLRPEPQPVDVLFWSGGKDSFLAYRALLREGTRPVVLLTTFDAASRTIAHQELRVELVIRQAEHLQVPLLGVPLHPGLAYEARIGEAVSLIPAVARFVFGDLHLEHIREWRTGAFRELAERRDASLHFPIWQEPCEVLMTDLEASGIVCEVSAVTDAARGALVPGQRFDRDTMMRLPDGVDRFGENGEFHTLAKVWEVAADRLPDAGIDSEYAARDLERAMAARWPDDVAGDR